MHKHRILELQKNGSSFIRSSKFIRFSAASDLPIYYCDYDSLYYSRCLFDEFEVPFPDSISSANLKRQSEFLAGRYAATMAMKRLGVMCSHIPSGENRNPCWPIDIVGSITHKNSVAASVVAKRDSVNCLGIDYEEWISPSVFRRIESSVINQKERALLDICGYSKEDAFTLIFSAKESLFKALYPSVRCYFSFSVAEVTNISRLNNTFEMTLCQTLTTDLPEGRNFKGHFSMNAGGVLTLIAA